MLCDQIHVCLVQVIDFDGYFFLEIVALNIGFIFKTWTFD